MLSYFFNSKFKYLKIPPTFNKSSLRSLLFMRGFDNNESDYMTLLQNTAHYLWKNCVKITRILIKITVLWGNPIPQDDKSEIFTKIRIIFTLKVSKIQKWTNYSNFSKYFTFVILW